jgi:hypothetical protein
MVMEEWCEREERGGMMMVMMMMMLQLNEWYRREFTE